MTSDLFDTTATSFSLTLGSRTKELCSFCKERPYDLVCQCGDKFDFNCIGSHVEGINFEYHDLHTATGSELEKLEKTKRHVRVDAHHTTIDNWVRLRMKDIEDIAAAAKSEFKTNEQIDTEAAELDDLYKKLHEIQDQSVHDRLTFIKELNEQVKKVQWKLQTMLSPIPDYSQLDESLRAKLSAATSTASIDHSHTLTNSLDNISSRQGSAAPTKNQFSAPPENASVSGRHATVNGFMSQHRAEQPLMNGFARSGPTTPESPPVETPTVSTSRTEATVPTLPVTVPPVLPRPEMPAASSVTRVQPPSVSSSIPEVPQTSVPSARPEAQPPAATRASFDAIPTATREELPAPPTHIPSFERVLPKINPPVEPPKASAKPEIPVPAPADNRNDDEFDAGLSSHISRRILKTIQIRNDQNAGTICSHDDQLLYVDYDDVNKKSQLIYLHSIDQENEELKMEWTPPPDTGSSGSDEGRIRDITYCDRLHTYLLITQTCIIKWNDLDDRFIEYHRLVGRQLKRITTDQHFMYLISASGRMTARGDTIIFLSYDKDEVSKAFTDIVPSRMNRGTAPLNGEITDIAVAPRDQLMITYRIERRSEVGICLFQVANRGRDWSCIKQLQLNECWHASLNYTPRVEWCTKLDVFILIEYMTGHLLMIGQDGQVKGECRFTNDDGKPESPINLTISNNDWFCTRYDSMIVVKKLQ